MGVARSLSRSTIKRDTSISWRRRYEFAHCSQLRVKRHVLFLPFTDRQAQQLFLPLHKSRDCFHTPPTGTVPFIKEIYLETSRGEAEESRERWALIKSFNENVWGSVCYFITTQPGSFLIEWGRVRFAACDYSYDPQSRQHSFIITTNSSPLSYLQDSAGVNHCCSVVPHHLCMSQWQLGW